MTFKITAGLLTGFALMAVCSILLLTGSAEAATGARAAVVGCKASSPRAIPAKTTADYNRFTVPCQLLAPGVQLGQGAHLAVRGGKITSLTTY